MPRRTSSSTTGPDFDAGELLGDLETGVLTDLDEIDRQRQRRLVDAQLTGGSTAQNPSPGEIPEVDPRIAEFVRYLLNRNELASEYGQFQTLAVVSALGREGVTTVSQAVAEVMAIDFGYRVCWVDLSWLGVSATGDVRKRRRRQKSPAASVETSTAAGLRQVLNGTVTLDDAIIRDDSGRLAHLAAGQIRTLPQRRDALRSALDEVLAKLRESFDIVVIDNAPLLGNSEALGVMRHVDTHVLVVRQGSASVDQVELVVEQLATVSQLGVVLNRFRSRTPGIVRRFFPD